MLVFVPVAIFQDRFFCVAILMNSPQCLITEALTLRVPLDKLYSGYLRRRVSSVLYFRRVVVRVVSQLSCLGPAFHGLGTEKYSVLVQLRLRMTRTRYLFVLGCLFPRHCGDISGDVLLGNVGKIFPGMPIWFIKFYLTHRNRFLHAMQNYGADELCVAVSSFGCDILR